MAFAERDWTAGLRPEALGAPESGIVEVVNYGRERPGLTPLWVGEGDLPTPGFIAEAAARSLAAGETFYTYQRGIPELREAIARYLQGLYGRAFDPQDVFVTGSGMHAIQIAVRMLAGAGDEVVLPTPVWPNLAAALGIVGARAVPAPMRFGHGGWRLDLDSVFDACGPRTRALFFNTPANPTGWTMSLDEMRAALDFARRRNLWIIADEIYTRFVYGRARAPSFFDVMEEGDRILFVNSFSKNWAMTGWRVGWLAAPRELGQIIENLVQYTISGVPVFSQRAALAAIEGGEDFVRFQVARAAQGRAIVCDRLEATGRARFVRPDGAFYLFFAVDGFTDSRALALRLVDEANVGLAPGTAFGPGGEAFLRLCFLTGAEKLEPAADRLASWIKGL
jgi:aspartate/methionine/tyrosine aminotransferase